MNQRRYYPCIMDNRTGRISVIVGTGRPSSLEKAENYLKRHHYRAWCMCEAIPQHIKHPYFNR